MPTAKVQCFASCVTLRPVTQETREEGSQMRITCRKCGKVQEADEKTAVCPDCRTILRRCVDCAQYEVRTAVCRVYNRVIPAEERHYPTFSANSTYCRSYVPSNPPPA
jgi:Fe-S-cluster containining protein